MKMKSLIASSIILALSACNDSSVSAEAGNSIGAVTLSGDSLVGSTLSAMVTDGNGLESASISYEWLADDKVISGATASAYLLTATEVEANI